MRAVLSEKMFWIDKAEIRSNMGYYKDFCRRIFKYFPLKTLFVRFRYGYQLEYTKRHRTEKGICFPPWFGAFIFMLIYILTIPNADRMDEPRMMRIQTGAT